MAGDLAACESWIGWPVERAVRAFGAAGRPVERRTTGAVPADVRVGGAELVLAVRDPGSPAPVTLISAWVPGAAAAAWAQDGGAA